MTTGSGPESCLVNPQDLRWQTARAACHLTPAGAPPNKTYVVISRFGVRAGAGAR
jgi:hypothetical protein